MEGLFLAGIGIGLTNAATWNHYEVFAYYFVIALEIAVVLWVTLSARIQLGHDGLVAQTFQDRDLTLRLERYAVMLVTRVSKAGFNTLHGWRAWWQAMVKYLWSGLISWKSVLDTSESKLSNWPVVKIPCS